MYSCPPPTHISIGLSAGTPWILKPLDAQVPLKKKGYDSLPDHWESRTHGYPEPTPDENRKNKRKI